MAEGSTPKEGDEGETRVRIPTRFRLRLRSRFALLLFFPRVLRGVFEKLEERSGDVREDADRRLRRLGGEERALVGVARLALRRRLPASSAASLSAARALTRRSYATSGTE